MQVSASGGAATFAMQKAMEQQGVGMQILSQTVANLGQAAGPLTTPTDLQSQVLAAAGIGKNIDVVV